MAGAYRRPGDRKRGGRGKYRIWWIGADGKKRQGTGTTDRADSLRIAQRHESDAALERAGLVEKGVKKRREAAAKPLDMHVAEFGDSLRDKGDTPLHCRRYVAVILRMLAAAEVKSIDAIEPDDVRAALGAMRKAGRSARTCNHALGAVKGFVRWLEASNRIADAPRGLLRLTSYPEAEDARRVRRALTAAELERLLAAAEAGGPAYVFGHTHSKHSRIAITGPMRATIYRIAMGTGFRANELRSLTPESCRLDGPEPTITVAAGYTKNGKEAIQPIRRDLAATLKPFVEAATPGAPLLIVPARTAQMLRADLAAAGIAYETRDGVLDFHALRGSYITLLAEKGVRPKELQRLARHSKITLTLDRYVKTTDQKLRAALEDE